MTPGWPTLTLVMSNSLNATVIVSWLVLTISTKPDPLEDDQDDGARTFATFDCLTHRAVDALQPLGGDADFLRFCDGQRSLRRTELRENDKREECAKDARESHCADSEPLAA